MPHELLELEPWELGLAIQCVQQADATSAQTVDRITSGGGMVFPTVAVR